MKISLNCLCESRPSLRPIPTGLVCSSSDCFHSNPTNAFKDVSSIPVVVSEVLCDTVVDTNEIRSMVSRPAGRLGLLKKFLKARPTVTRRNCELFKTELLAGNDTARKVLIIGAGEPGSGTESLWAETSIEKIGVDIYPSPTVDVICDAHYLPFADESFDGVWVQAVLEHVVEPNRVVSEIYRVLKLGGIVYAETPFMQQVHEAAYDFTRFTVLGHRYLFRSFDALDFGGNKGAEVSLAWSIKYFVWAVTRSKSLGRLFGLIFGFLVIPFKHLTSKKSLFDASSGVYFLGKKTGAPPITHKNLVALYKGQQ